MSHFAYGFCFLSVWQLENVNKTFEMGPGVRLEIHMQRRRGRNETISCKNCSPRSNGDKTAGVEKETQAELNQNFSCWENIWLIFDLIMRMVFSRICSRSIRPSLPKQILQTSKSLTAPEDRMLPLWQLIHAQECLSRNTTIVWKNFRHHLCLEEMQEKGIESNRLI